MGYEPKTPRTRWMREQILAALREHAELNTTELAEAVGFLPAIPRTWCVPCCERHATHDDAHGLGRGVGLRPCQSQDMQPTMTSMERHGEIQRRRFHTSDLWRWSLGEGAPATIDADALEVLLRA